MTILIPARDGIDEVAEVLDAVGEQARGTGSEVLVVGGPPGPVPDGVRHLPFEDPNIFRLRLIGVHAALGEVIAIGEDHAIPGPGWCAAVISAHVDHPEAPAIVGCLNNVTDATVAGRANFVTFASPWAPPEPAVLDRPPPTSTLSFKRSAIAAVSNLGQLEAELVPELWGTRRLIGDGRIVVDHAQDGGVRWSVINAFHSARSSHGYARRSLLHRERLARARLVLTAIPRGLWREARAGRASMPGPRRDLALVGAIALAAGLGAASGLLSGPGRSPELVA